MLALFPGTSTEGKAGWACTAEVLAAFMQYAGSAMADEPSPKELRTPAARYSASRLRFDAAVIEPLGPDAPFQIDTPDGSFRMTKAEFHEHFANVAATASYRAGSYSYSTTPQKALRFRVAAAAPLPSAARAPGKNRQLSPDELLQLFRPLLADVRARLRELAGTDDALHFALRRKLFKELVYDERSKPMQRRALKATKRLEQGGRCALCGDALPARGAVLDRFEAMKGYIASNVRLLCPRCDAAEQEKKGYT